ncbi:MAG: Imm8 family immunity protein [Acidobacteriota bacterium]
MSTDRFYVWGVNRIGEVWGTDLNEFSIHLQVEIADRQGGEGGEAVTVYVVSPAHLAKCLDSSGEPVESGHGCLYMVDYDEAAIVAYLQKLISGLRASSWSELDQLLGRYFPWV